MYLSNNLPPDDVAMEMNSRELLAKTEHDTYLSMKLAHTSTTTKSEYLLQCLGRRKAGFLTQFCEILRGIKQASYLVDDIIKAYKTASHQQGTSCNFIQNIKFMCIFDSYFLLSVKFKAWWPRSFVKIKPF